MWKQHSLLKITFTEAQLVPLNVPKYDRLRGILNISLEFIICTSGCYGASVQTEDNTQESVLSFHYVGPTHRTGHQDWW